MKLINLNHVTKAYGNKKALDDISLTLEAGKIYGLCGNNGAGKSTLIQLLSSVKQATHGDIFFRDHLISYLDRNEIAYFADESFFTDDTKIIEIFDLYEHFFDDFDSKKCASLVYQNKISPDTTLSSLSKGMRVKLELSFTISRNAKLYLFDEPFANLDPLAREEVMQMIISCGREDATYLISTHIISDFESYFEHVLFLQDGHFIVDCAVDSIFETQKCSVQEYLKRCLKANTIKES